MKNLFALAGSVVTLSACTAGTPKELAEAVRERLAALARAHDLTLPDLTGGGEKSGQATSLPALVRTIVSLYVTQEDARVIVEGPDVPIGGNAVTGIALLLRLRLTLRNMGRYRLKAATLMSVGPCGRTNFCWHGGPPLNGQPEKEGFGSLLARLTATGQFTGKISRDWNREGLTVNLSAPLERLTM